MALAARSNYFINSDFFVNAYQIKLIACITAGITNLTHEFHPHVTDVIVSYIHVQ